MRMRKKVVAVALIGIALASFAIAGFASALTSKGAKQSGVFAKVYGSGAWIDLTTEWQTLLSITLPNIPMSVYYYVVCDGYAALQEEGTEIEIAIGVDSATEDGSTLRFYGFYWYGATGIHTERLYYLGPGSHTFYFLGRKFTAGAAAVNYHTITVIVFTDGSLIELSETAEVGVAPDGVSE